MSTRIKELPADFWRALALLRDRELCRADWERRLGAGFAAASQFLKALPGTVADTFPDPESGLPLIPRRVHDGTYTARPDDREETCIEPITKLKPAQVARWQIAWDEVGEAVAQALGIEVHVGPGPFETPYVRSLGVQRISSGHLSVLLLIATNDQEALGWIRHLLRSEPRFFVLPFHDQLCESQAIAHGHHFSTLDRDTFFASSRGRWTLKERRVPQPATKTSTAADRPIWSQTELQKVRIVGDFNEIHFIDGTVLSLRGRARCRAFLVFLLKICLREKDFTFAYEEVREDYNATKPQRPIKSDALDHELFRDFKGFARIFETINRAEQRFRLLIRPR